MWLYSRLAIKPASIHMMTRHLTTRHFSPFFPTVKDNRKTLDLSMGILYTTVVHQSVANKNIKTIVLLFMALVLFSNAWDTELNPGPRGKSYVYKGKYPCQICRQATKWGQEALACEGCNCWYHRDCMEMRASDYKNFRDSSLMWICDKCDLPNYSTTLFSSYIATDGNQFQPLLTQHLNDSTFCSSIGDPQAASSPVSTNTMPSPGFPDTPSELRSSANLTRPLSSLSNERSHLPPLQRKRDDKPMRIIIINCHSIKDKATDLANLIRSTDPDIVIGTESWLKPSDYSSEYFPTEDYCDYRNDRSGKFGMSKGGGVFILVSRRFNSSRVVEAETDSNELVWVQIELKYSKKLYVGSLYRPEHTDLDYINDLDTSISGIGNNSDAHIWLGGDLNLPGADWTALTTKPGDKYKNITEAMMDTTQKYGLDQVVDKPTYITESSQNTLDLFFTNNSTLVNRVETMPSLADHETVFLEVSTKARVNQKPPRQVPMFAKADWPQMREELNQIASNTDWLSMDVNHMWDTFKSNIHLVTSKYIPTKTIKHRKNYVPYMTSRIKKLIRRRDNQYYKWKKQKTHTQRNKYVDLKKQVTKELRHSYWSYIENIITDDSSTPYDNTRSNFRKVGKRFWGYIKSLRKDATGVAPLKQDGCLISEAKGKASILNDQYKSVFTTENVDCIPHMGTSPYPDLPPLDITTPGVTKLLKGLNTDKAQGPDQLPPRILKELADVLSTPLTYIFDSSIRTGMIPEDWKRANISPIFKKGDTADPGNYRPVSLTSVCAKLLEHIIVKHIVQHLDLHNILKDCQHGFRSRRSCETQLLTFIQDLASNMVNGGQTDIILMDFSKAFDKVPHQRLLVKLEYYGVRSNILKWIEHFLTQRHQRVVVDGQHSDFVKVQSGVPQGTVLGPLLFLCFINDLPDVTSSPVRLFADDAVVYRKISSEADNNILQQDLNNLAAWEAKWQMAFHPKKCVVLHITRSQSPSHHSYYLRGCKLNNVDTATYLGVTLDKKLDWHAHIDNITSKSTRTLNFVRRNLRVSSPNVRETGYRALVRPTLDYACSVWDPHLMGQKRKIEMVQRRAARFVTNRYHNTSSVSSMLSDLHWESLEERRSKFKLTMVYRILHNYVAVPVQPYFQFTTCRTRRNHDYTMYQQHAPTDYLKGSFFVSVIPAWNLLPNNIVSAPSLDSFKTRLAAHQLQAAYEA